MGFVAVLGLAIGARLLAGLMDRKRIAEYIEQTGGRVRSTEWTPFGSGWFGSKEERIYRVRYVDIDGCTHTFTCKTKLFAGVYFTDDRTGVHSHHSQKAETSEDEKRHARDAMRYYKDPNGPK